MTSPRYLNDKADSKDLLRSFVKVIPYAVIALVVLSIQHIPEVLQFVTTPEFRRSKAASQVISYFGNDGFLYPSLVRYGMVLCGIIIAVTLFRFMLTKKSVNVYFSMGITRTRLYINRILAGVLALILAVLIPIGITLIINIASFGWSQHLLEVFLYEFSVLFLSGFAGFSIAAVASTFSGSIVETVLNTAAFSFLPTIIADIVMHIKNYFLYGYMGVMGQEEFLVQRTWANIVSPWAFAVDSDVKNGLQNFVSDPYPELAQIVNKTVPESNALDWGLVLPLIIWTLVPLVLLAVGYLLINKRKAEHANSFGKFSVSAAVLGTTVFFGAATLLLMIFGELYTSTTVSFLSGRNPFFRNIGLCLFCMALILFIVFFVAELIIRRKLKATVRMWPVFVAALAVTVFGVVFYTSGEFGTYNKLPAQADIRAVAIDIFDPTENFASHLFQNNVYLSTDAEDIKLAEDQFVKISNSKSSDGKDTVPVTFKFILKDGSTMMRRFNVYDSKIFEEYARAVYASNYFKGNMKYLMLDKATKAERDYADSEESSYYTDALGNRVYYSAGERQYPGMLRDIPWYYASGDCIADNYYTVANDGGYYYYASSDNAAALENTDGLFNALYNDLCKLSFDEMYMNAKRPVAVLFREPDNADYADDKYISVNEWEGYYSIMRYADYMSENKHDASFFRNNSAAMIGVNGNIFIYDNMTETIAYLNANGYNIDTHPAKVKEVYYTDAKLSGQKAVEIISEELAKTDKDFYHWGSEIDGNFYSEFFSFSHEIQRICYAECFSYEYSKLGENKTFTPLDILNEAYQKAGHPLKKADTAEKAQQIADKSVPFYCNYNDDGRYAYIVYEDNVIVCQYIPSASVSVLG